MAKKTGSDEIFTLIQALTTEEKGYFKKFSKRYSEKEGLLTKLFDAINNQSTYSEDELKKAFPNLAVLKSQLFEQITDALLLMSSENDNEDGLWKKYKAVEILHSKGLTERALKINNKACEQSLQAEVFPVYERFLKQNFNIKRATLSPSEYLTEITLLYKLLNNVYQASQVANQNFYYFGLMHAKETQVNTPITKEQLFKDIPELASLINDTSESEFYVVKRTRLNALAKYHYLISENDKAVKLLHELADMERKLIAENNPAQRRENYYTTLNGLIYNYYSTNRFKEAFEVNEYAATLTSSNKEIDLEKFVFYAYHNSILLFESKEFKKGEDFATQTLNSILPKRHLSKSHALLSIVGFKLLFEWINGNIKTLLKSLAMADEVFSDIEKQGFKSHLEIFRLIVNIEAENFKIAKSDAKKALESKSLVLTKTERKLIEVTLKTLDSNNKTTNKALLSTLNESEQSLRLFNITTIESLLNFSVT